MSESITNAISNDYYKCCDCSEAILCPTWGQYKCRVLKEYIHSTDAKNCKHYKKGTPSTDCHCEDCERRNYDK